jgi:hypothetical protein
LTLILIILMLMVTFLISYKIVFNQHNFIEIIRKTDYVNQSIDYISGRLDNYVTKGLYYSLVNKDKINNDIILISSRFFNHHEKVDATRFKNDTNLLFYNNIKAYMENEDIVADDESINKLANILTDVYVSNVFPITELERVENQYERFDKISSHIMLICILLLGVVISSMFMLTSRSKITYINRALMSSLIILLFSRLVLDITDIYYLNEYATIFLKNLVNQFMIVNMMIILIYIVLVIILYIVYIKNKLKQNPKKYLYKH